jgi:ferric-dicitrate binding protein FerR (iron transport regulator)
MRNRFFALGLALFLTLSHAASASAGTPQPSADWSAVRSLAPGQKVAVSTKDGDRLKGRFDSATETDVSFTHEGRRVTLTRESIRRVEVGRRNRWKGALVGAGVGGGAGAGGGTGLLAASDHFDNSIIAAGTAVGAGIGAGIGAAVGLGTDYGTVYEAQ